LLEVGSTPSRAFLLSRKLRTAALLWKTSGPMGVVQSAATKLWPVLSPMAYKSLQMSVHLGYWPHIRSPRSFNEKIAHRQLFAPNPLAPLVADKWRVRQFVAEHGLAHILNEVYFVTDEPERIPFDDLPDRFVVKANHGGGMNILVTAKKSLDRPQVIRQCRKWLSTKYGEASRAYETHYDSIPPLILVERFIEEEGRVVPVDYKFLCFHGEALYIYVIDRRYRQPTLTFYDPEWTRMDVGHVYPSDGYAPKPTRLEEMVRIAENLSAGFDFVRIDLYSPNNGSIVFGEMTLSPTGGLGRFCPREWDFRLGKLW
jgi:hypothetical protein